MNHVGHAHKYHTKNAEFSNDNISMDFFPTAQ